MGMAKTVHDGNPRFASPLPSPHDRERGFFIDNLPVRIHFIIVMIRWTGLAPWEFEFPFPGSLTSTFLTGGAWPRGPHRRAPHQVHLLSSFLRFSLELSDTQVYEP